MYPPGQRERVEVVRVHHVELPVEIRPRCDVRQRIPEDLEVSIDRRILDDRQLGVHLLRLIRPDLYLLLL